MRRAGKIGPIEGFSAGAVTQQASARLTVSTPGQGFTDITGAVAGFVQASGLQTGLVTVFCRHTSASLTIQENADPDVQTDLLTALDSLAPRNAGWVHGMEGPGAIHSQAPRYTHNTEGPDDMPAHIRTMLTDISLSIPIMSSRIVLGTWQGIYLIEHRDQPHLREIILQAIGK